MASWCELELALTRLKFNNFYDICMSDQRRNIEFLTMGVRVNRAHYESRELGISCDDLCASCTDLTPRYQDLLRSDKSFLRVI